MLDISTKFHKEFLCVQALCRWIWSYRENQKQIIMVWKAYWATCNIPLFFRNVNLFRRFVCFEFGQTEVKLMIPFSNCFFSFSYFLFFICFNRYLSLVLCRSFIRFANVVWISSAAQTSSIFMYWQWKKSGSIWHDADYGF